jgi:hypothetical protein
MAESDSGRRSSGKSREDKQTLRRGELYELPIRKLWVGMTEARPATCSFCKIGRPIKGGLYSLANQPTSATRSWAFASVSVAGWTGSWSTIAS